MNCTVRITADRAEAWVPTQNARSVAGRALRRSRACRSRKCEVYKHILGGGFGRRGGTQDYVRQAVAIASSFPACR